MTYKAEGIQSRWHPIRSLITGERKIRSRVANARLKTSLASLRGFQILSLFAYELSSTSSTVTRIFWVWLIVIVLIPLDVRITGFVNRYYCMSILQSGNPSSIQLKQWFSDGCIDEVLTLQPFMAADLSCCKGQISHYHAWSEEVRAGRLLFGC